MDATKEKILQWLATGEVGASSQAMALAVAGYRNDGSYPHDPDDLRRCLLLIAAVPEIRQNMDRVAAINKTWARLVARWDELEKCFMDEVGLNPKRREMARRTYAMMKDIGC